MEKVADFLRGEEAFDRVAAEVGQRRVVEVGLDQTALCEEDLLNGSKEAYLLGVVVVGLDVALEAALHHLRVIGDGIEGEQVAEEGEKVVNIMKKNGLDRKKDKKLKIYVMCEIPSNVISAQAFLNVFDGMSIGSNDLTQLTMGIDRDSTLLGGIANENNPAVVKIIKDVIKICRKRKKYVGICGQAPSDFPEFSDFLVKNRIGSISLNPDSIIKTLPRIYKEERKISRIIRR